jgi:hypothetical protein
MTSSSSARQDAPAHSLVAGHRPALVVVGGPGQRAPAPHARLLAALPEAAQVLVIQAGPSTLQQDYQRRHPASVWTSLDLGGPTPASVLPDGVFDLIVLPGLLPWLGDPSGLLRALVARLAPGGRLLLSCDQQANHQWLQRWIDADLSVTPGEALSTGQPRLMSVSTLFKLLMDAGWMPHLQDHEPSPALPAPAQAAVAALTTALGRSPAGSAQRVHGMAQVIVEARPLFAALPAAQAAANFDVVVPTTDEHQLRVHVEASPGLREVGATIVSCRGAAHPADALALARAQTQSPWVLLCHQDVYFPEGFGHRLNALLAGIAEPDRARTLIGFIGMGVDRQTQASEPAGFVIDRLHRADHGESACAVSLDELAIVIARDSLLTIDPALGWHLWATDLCLSAICDHRVFPRIVRMPLFHNSRTGWHNPAGFEASARTLQHKWAGFGPIHTLCGVIDASAVATAA